MNEQLYNALYYYIENSEYPKEIKDQHEKIQLEKLSKKYIIQKRNLFRQTKEGKYQRVILPDQTELILYNLHKDQNGAHLGIESTYEKLKERYYWPQMYESIKQYIKSCDNCQRRGKPNRREELIPIKVTGIFKRIGIDIKGPLPITKNGNKYIIVAMDYFSKWPEAKAIPNAKADTVAEFIYKEIICRHGVPDEILSDRGTSFINQVVDGLCDKFQTKHRLTSSYRPQTNGMIERFNRTIGECIAKLLSDKEKEWDEYIDAVLLAYRTMKHESTKFTPAQLYLGRQMKLPVELKVITFQEPKMTFEETLRQRTIDIMEKWDSDKNKALDNIEKGQEKQKKRFNKRSQKLKIGDKVLVHRTDLQNNMSAKLNEQWIGPYFIHDVLEHNVYKLRNMDGKLVKNVINGNRLKLYYEQQLKPMIIIE